MQMREAAERILFAQSLEEKLLLPPELGDGVSDDAPGKAVGVPDAPGRPDELRIVKKGVRAGFPGVNRLDEDHERGKMMHFLANHELLAAELMALVLLKFPDAPKEYRRGVYEAMREEQMHTRMYLRRMKDCGIAFGELPNSGAAIYQARPALYSGELLNIGAAILLWRALLTGWPAPGQIRSLVALLVSALHTLPPSRVLLRTPKSLPPAVVPI